MSSARRIAEATRAAALTRPALAAGVAALLLLLAAAPEPVVLGALRLAAHVILVAGAWLLIGRAGAADLATAAAVAAGAYLGGVAPALLGAPPPVGVVTGALAGGVVGAAAGAVHGRLGRTLGALASLALGTALVAVAGAWAGGGGVAGFHAVALPTPWGDRADLVAVGLASAGALAVTAAVARHRLAARAAIAVRAPTVAAALGLRPVVAGARLGAVAGAVLGGGGAVLATVTGSVFPDAYGLELTAALALAALVGGPAPLGPVLGTLVVWGPATVWPLAPLVGTAPPLLVAGPMGLVLLALRRGRPLLDVPVPVAARPAGADPPPSPRTPDRGGAADGAGPAPDDGEDPAPAGAAPPALAVAGLEVPAGRVDLHVAAGEVVALVGPNGAGKSTLLAAVGGQVDDHGTVELAGRRVPARARARARAGVARTWQRPPRLSATDARTVTVTDVAARAAWDDVAEVLGAEEASMPDPGVLQLLLVAARRPRVALLDEPTDLAPERVVACARRLATAGAAVLVVDHRREVADAADRVVRIGDASTSDHDEEER